MSQNTSDLDKAKELLTLKQIYRIADEGRVGLFKVKGKTGEYLVAPPGFCSCIHFQFRCIKIPSKLCYHLIAVMMCKDAMDIYDVDILAFFE